MKGSVRLSQIHDAIEHRKNASDVTAQEAVKASQAAEELQRAAIN